MSDQNLNPELQSVLTLMGHGTAAPVTPDVPLQPQFAPQVPQQQQPQQPSMQQYQPQQMQPMQQQPQFTPQVPQQPQQQFAPQQPPQQVTPPQQSTPQVPQQLQPQAQPAPVQPVAPQPQQIPQMMQQPQPAPTAGTTVNQIATQPQQVAPTSGTMVSPSIQPAPVVSTQVAVKPTNGQLANFDRAAVLRELQEVTLEQVATVVPQVARLQVISGRTEGVDSGKIPTELMNCIINSSTMEILAKPSETFRVPVAFYHTEYLQTFPYKLRQTEGFIKQRSICDNSPLAEKVRDGLWEEPCFNKDGQPMYDGNTQFQFSNERHPVFTFIYDNMPLLGYVGKGRIIYFDKTLWPQVLSMLNRNNVPLAQLVFTIGTEVETRYNPNFLTWVVKKIEVDPNPTDEHLAMSRKIAQTLKKRQEQERQSGWMSVEGDIIIDQM